MSTFQKFIHYYKPYKKVFIFDLICAAFISLERNERRNKILRELANSRKTRVKRGSNEIFEKEQKL